MHGGMGTSSLVTTFGPMGDGERALAGGFCRELVETMHQRGFLGPGVRDKVSQISMPDTSSISMDSIAKAYPKA